MIALFRHQLHVWLCVGGLLAGLTSCRDGPLRPADTTAPPPDAGAATTADGRSVRQRPLRANELDPSFSTAGPPEAAPTRWVLRFDRAVAPRGMDRPGEQTAFQIEPSAEGELRFTTPSTLVFIPDRPLEPGTTYRWTISKLDIGPRSTGTSSAEGDETIRTLEPKEAWTDEIQTPEFGLSNLSPAVRTGGKESAAVELRFTAPVDADKLGAYADWRIDGRPVADARYRPGPSPNSIRALLSSPAFAEADRARHLDFVLDSGLPHHTGAAATAERAQIPLKSGPAMRIESIELEDGPSGRSIRVTCSTGDRPDRAGGAADPCRLEPESAERSITLDPSADMRPLPTDSGFRLRGDLERTSYWLRIGAGLETENGAVLRSSQVRTIDVPARARRLEIPVGGRYLTRRSWRQLPVRHRNVEYIGVEVRRVPRPNMVFWMSRGPDTVGRRTSNRVVATSVPVDGELDRLTTSRLDLRHLLGRPQPGIYEIELSAGRHRDLVRILPTDISLVAKRAAPPEGSSWSRSVTVWARDTETLRPLPGVHLELIRRSGDVLARCQTGPTGGCTLEPADSSIDPSPPFAVVARRRNDVSYLKFGDVRTRPENANLGGARYGAETAVAGLIHADRSSFRPGERARIFVALRTAAGVAPAVGTDVQIEFRDPEGHLAHRAVRSTNRAGIVTLERPFAGTASTGFWKVAARVSGETVASKPIEIAERPRTPIDVDVETSSSDYQFADLYELDVRTSYPYGATPEGNRLELTCSVEPTSFQPDRNRDYTYGPARLLHDLEPLTPEPIRRVFGRPGKLDLFCRPLDPAHALPTTGRLRVTAEVHESGSSRTAVGRATARVHPARHYLGLDASVDRVEAGETYSVNGVVVDWNGDRTSDVDSVELELANLHAERSADTPDGAGTWHPELEETRRIDVTSKGTFSFEVTPEAVADGYLVRARAGKATTELVLEPARTRHWRRRPRRTWDRTPSPEPPRRVAIDAPDSIEVGSRQTIEFEAPFAGEALLTVETDRLLRHEWREVDAGTNEWTFSLDESPPNVYVGALVLRSNADALSSALFPDRAFGLESVEVASPNRRQNPELDLPGTVQPGETVRVGVDLGDSNGPWWIAVAVDGSGRGPPQFDATRQLLQKRAVGVRTYDTIGWTLARPPPRAIAGGPKIVGGERGSEPNRPPDDASTHASPATGSERIWVGPHRVGEGGPKTVEFEAPNETTSLEVTVFAFSPDQIGQSSAQLEVRAPVEVRADAPTSLTEGDRLRLPVVVTNRTDRSRRIRVHSAVRSHRDDRQAAGPRRRTVRLEDSPTRSMRLAGEKSSTALFALRAPRAGTSATLEIRVESGSWSRTLRRSLPVRPARLGNERIRRLEPSNSETDLAKNLRSWRDSRGASTFWLTPLQHGRALATAAGSFTNAPDSLERTATSLRSLLAAPKLLQHLRPTTLPDEEAVDRAIGRRLDRLEQLQRPAGGFAFWPGEREIDPWGTAFAAATIRRAREAGRAYPASRLEEALDWLARQVPVRPNDAAGEAGAPYEPAGLAYIHYVLARHDRGRPAAIRDRLARLDDDPEGSERESKYLLRAALWTSGDRRHERFLRNPPSDANFGGRTTGGSLYSHQRARALMLAVHGELFADGSGADPLAKRVARDLTQWAPDRYTTQELGWGFEALATHLESPSASPDASARLLADRSPVSPAVRSAQFGTTWNLTAPSRHDSLLLEMPTAWTGRRDLIVRSTGRRRSPRSTQSDEGLGLRREYRTRAGDLSRLGTQSLGDVVYIHLSLKNRTAEDLENVAIVDRLPAGWTLEETDVGPGDGPNWVDSSARWRVDHREADDRRVRFVGDLRASDHVSVVYAARATHAGSFRIPPARAEALYDPSIQTRRRGRRTTIIGPWRAPSDNSSQ